MGFVKVQKNKAYYKRLQTKYRRRREGKTDYHARRKMCAQDKNKYQTPKYRLVARITNKKIICQIVWATIQGDRVLCQALSSELPNYGVPAGLTNYAACYATGLLVARRALAYVGLADAITGPEECTAEEYHVEEEDNDRRPFKVILDAGLIRTIPGSRVFGILKGAVDGGLHIPHSVSKMPGYEEPADKGEDYQYDASAHLDRILGVHVQEYMDMLKEEDPERYKVAFSKFIDEDKEEGLDDMYKECHAAIRENPTYQPDEETKKQQATLKNTRKGDIISVMGDGFKKPVEYKRAVRKSHQMRKSRVQQKMNAAVAKIAAAGEADEE